MELIVTLLFPLMVLIWYGVEVKRLTSKGDSNQESKNTFHVFCTIGSIFYVLVNLLFFCYSFLLSHVADGNQMDVFNAWPAIIIAVFILLFGQSFSKRKASASTENSLVEIKTKPMIEPKHFHRNLYIASFFIVCGYILNFFIHFGGYLFFFIAIILVYKQRPIHLYSFVLFVFAILGIVFSEKMI